MVSTAPLPLRAIADVPMHVRPMAAVPRHIRFLCRSAPGWSGCGQMPANLFDVPARAMLVLEGIVLVSSVRPSGRVVAFALLAPGDLWMRAPRGPGEQDLAIRADALGRTAVSFLERDATVVADPQVAAWLADTQLRRAIAAERHAALVLSLPAEERIIVALAEVARAGGVVLGDGRIRLSAPISQERLGWIAGTTRESANRVVASLIARGELFRERGRYVLPAGFSLRGGPS
jgi:CRP-like cAMP-binding protein